MARLYAANVNKPLHFHPSQNKDQMNYPYGKFPWSKPWPLAPNRKREVVLTQFPGVPK